jgi:hypothetical protein
MGYGKKNQQRLADAAGVSFEAFGSAMDRAYAAVERGKLENRSVNYKEKLEKELQVERRRKKTEDEVRLRGQMMESAKEREALQREANELLKGIDTGVKELKPRKSSGPLSYSQMGADDFWYIVRAGT